MGVIYERNSAENFIEAVCDNTTNMVNFEKSFLISLLWKQVEERDQVKLMLKFYNDLSLEGQSDLFSFLGNALNEDLYKSSKQGGIIGKDLNLEDLKNSCKFDFYKSNDIRLKSFINYITECKTSSCDNDNFKSNVYEYIPGALNM